MRKLGQALGMMRFSITIPSTLTNKLREVCSKQGNRSLSSLVQEILRNWITQHEERYREVAK